MAKRKKNPGSKAQVAEAIDESIRDNRTVIITVTSAKAEALRDELYAVSDGNADRNDGTHEFWGSDDEGNDWRVHLVTSRAKKSNPDKEVRQLKNKLLR